MSSSADTIGSLGSGWYKKWCPSDKRYRKRWSRYDWNDQGDSRKCVHGLLSGIHVSRKESLGIEDSKVDWENLAYQGLTTSTFKNIRLMDWFGKRRSTYANGLHMNYPPLLILCRYG
jgi:hypothetical protein